jgi:predicted alpha/beta hydrolase
VERDFYVRQLRDWKMSASPELMEPRTMTVYAQVCGRVLARAHARGGDRVAIAAYLGSSETFDHAVADFATAYADVTERDHAALVDAIGAGRVVAERGL